MNKNIVGFFISLDAVSNFFKEKEEEEKEFSQYGDSEERPYIKSERHHFVLTEDDSITKQMRGY